MAVATRWQVRGSYFESSNCDPTDLGGLGGDAETHQTVTCVIPGHDRDGAELVAELRVNDGPLAFDCEGTCGCASTFDYSGG